MIITYPDQITHKAIIKTFCEYVNSAVATGDFVCPKLILIPGQKLGISADKEELMEIDKRGANQKFNDFSNLLRSRIQKNMEF